MSSAIGQTEEFEAWLDGLCDPKGKLAIAKRLVRAEAGNFGDHKFLGDKISEMRIDVGPGYRIYYTMVKRIAVILLCGGDKSTQDSDIAKAKEMAAEIHAAADE